MDLFRSHLFTGKRSRAAAIFSTAGDATYLHCALFKIAAIAHCITLHILMIDLTSGGLIKKDDFDQFPFAWRNTSAAQKCVRLCVRVSWI